MNKLIQMLEEMVSQGEAQFKCGDKYATFSKHFIARARLVLDQVKEMPTSQQLLKAAKEAKEAKADDRIDEIISMTIRSYLLGYVGCLEGEGIGKTIDSIKLMTNKDITI